MTLFRNWPMHNIVAHPVMEVLSWFGAIKLAQRIHDATLPADAK